MKIISKSETPIGRRNSGDFKKSPLIKSFIALLSDLSIEIDGDIAFDVKKDKSILCSKGTSLVVFNTYKDTNGATVTDSIPYNTFNQFFASAKKREEFIQTINKVIESKYPASTLRLEYFRYMALNKSDTKSLEEAQIGARIARIYIVDITYAHIQK